MALKEQFSEWDTVKAAQNIIKWLILKQKLSVTAPEKFLWSNSTKSIT